MLNKDIIATIENAVKDLEKEDADTIRSQISLMVQSLKFSMEEETVSFKSSCQELAFLDILLKHNGKISILVHRKPTKTYQYLQYGTNH